jgi:ABC-type microcin C transport system permease subunit YejE
MAADKSDRQLDEILRQSLLKYPVAVPEDFTTKLSRKLREEQQRRLLAKVVLQERIALAGCILLVVVAAIFVVVFSGIAGIFIPMMTWIDEVSRAIEALYYQPQYYMIFFVVVLGFAIYSLVDLLVGDR